MKYRKLAYPYGVWMLIFIIVPVVLVAYYALTNKGFDSITFDNFKRFFSSNNFLVLLDSMRIAFITTIICLVIGYPVAYMIANMKVALRNVMLLLVVVPMWMNFLLRTYAWMIILNRNGLLNKLLEMLHISPVHIMYTDVAIILGMVYNFLPFMILPIYTIIEKLDKSYIEASFDLGANSWKTFWKIVFPLSLPGVVTGITMVFIPAVSTFEISALLGGNKYNLIGNIIEHQFRVAGNWHFGSSMSLVLMAIILLLMMISNKINPDSEKSGGGLW